MTPEVARPGKADLHIHTSFSDGMANAREVLGFVERFTDLDVIAVTDHDDIRGAWLAREAWAHGRYRFQMVTGVEVTTNEGHLLGLFVEDPLPNLCPVEEAVEAIHRQGGLAVVPHPLSRLTRSLDARNLRRIGASEVYGVHFDAIETANQTPAGKSGARRAAQLNRSHLGLPEVGGSDAHFLNCIGTAYTEFPGRTAAELKAAVLAGATRAVNGYHPSMLEIGAGQVLRQTWRGIMTTPRRMGWGATAASFLRAIAGRVDMLRREHLKS
jgi:predicted metal-dependent phosphoesterase TrpH